MIKLQNILEGKFGEEHDYANYGGPWGTGHHHKTSLKKGPGKYPTEPISSHWKQFVAKDNKITGYTIVTEEKQKELEPSLKLPPGKKIVLRADTDDHDRGLVVTWRKTGGYDIYYWYGNPSKAVPAEVKADGDSIGDNIKKVYLGYHPELDKDKNEK